MAKPLLLIAGIPAAGKSYFSEWLESRHEFLYLEVYNHDPHRDRSMVLAGLEKEWACCRQGNACSQFVEALRERRKPIVLEWGFPVRCIQAVRALKESGFSIWWFDADYEVARKKFVERARDKLRDFDSQMRDFDVQMRGIEKQWLNIKALFDPNIITTLDNRELLGRRGDIPSHREWVGQFQPRATPLAAWRPWRYAFVGITPPTGKAIIENARKPIADYRPAPPGPHSATRTS